MNYRKILVPYDMSEMSDAALTHAVEFAKAYKAEIVLMTVVEPIRMPALGFLSGSEPGEMRKVLRRSTIELKEETGKMLEKRSKEIAKKGIKISKILVVATDPANRIIKVARSRKIDLVIIASRRLRRLAKLKTLGSVSRKVSENARCPVLIVR